LSNRPIHLGEGMGGGTGHDHGASGGLCVGERLARAYSARAYWQPGPLLRYNKRHIWRIGFWETNRGATFPERYMERGSVVTGREGQSPQHALERSEGSEVRGGGSRTVRT